MESNDKSLVRISNALNLSRQEFTANEKHILLLTLLHLKSSQGFELKDTSKNEILYIKFRTKELKETNYDRIQQSLHKIVSRKVFIDRSTAKKDNYIYLVPFTSAEYTAIKDVDSTIEIGINPACKPLLLELAKGYTEIDLKAVLELKSSHTIRMYELLSMRIKTGTWTVGVDELKDYLDLEPESYSTFTLFERRVLEYSQKELARSCGIYFDWEVAAKERKKITALKFNIRNSEQEDKLILKEETSKTIDYISALSDIQVANKVRIACQGYSLTEKQIQWILESKDRVNELIRIDLIIADKEARGKGPQNRTKYLAKSLGLDKIVK